MTLAPPIPYSASLETVLTGEAETIDKINAAFDEILDTTVKDYGHAVRAVHAMAHGILKGTLARCSLGETDVKSMHSRYARYAVTRIA